MDYTQINSLLDDIQGNDYENYQYRKRLERLRDLKHKREYYESCIFDEILKSPDLRTIMNTIIRSRFNNQYPELAEEIKGLENGN